MVNPMTAKLTPATVRALLDRATKGPWRVVEYDAGDTAHYDHNGPCPSIQAPDDQDCAIVHWDGFKQKYWSSANGNQREITANAAMIASAPDIAAAYLEALAVIEEIAGTEWQEMEPSSGWIPDGAEGYVGEMENFCNWATKHASAFLAKHKEQEA